MYRSTALLIFSLFLFGCASAQPPQISDDTRLSKTYSQIAAEDLARFEFDHGTFDAFMDQSTKAMIEVARPKLEESLGRELTRSEDKKLAEICKKVFFEVYPKEVWIEALTKLYARVFTIKEINEILAFYQTETGMHFLEKQTALLQKVEKMATKVVDNKVDKFVELFEEEFRTAFPSMGTELFGEIEKTSELNISESIQACKEIQNSPELPFGCRFDYLEGRPTIDMIFQNYETAEQYWEAISNEIAGPFCHANNEVNRQAMVFVSIQPLEMARILSCESYEWSEWFSYKGTES